MNGLMTSDFHRERFTDPTCRMKGSEAHSPQAADVVKTALTNKNLDFKSVNCNSVTGNSSHIIPEDTSNQGDLQRSAEGRSDSALERPAEEKSSDYSGENNSSLDKSFEGDYYSNKYTTENSNSSDLESDIDRDELIPNSPRSEVNQRQPIDYFQRLPSNLPFGSGFSPEEARLRLQLKEIGPLNPGAFAESEYRRHLAFSNGKGGGLIPNSSSQPNSPESKTPGSAILYPRRLPRSADELDETLKPNIREGLYFCHLCSFSGTTQAAFDQHMTVHFEHVCPHCDYKSRTEGRLKRHIKDFHTEDPDGGYGARTMPGRPKVFRCKQCEFSTTDKIEFWSHSRTHIKEDKLLQCPRCPFVTEYKHHLEYHLRNHFGSKPFKCPKCNYACVNKSMLNSHMKSHTNVYQYRCADCTYATKYCHSLKLHLRKYNHKPAAVLNSDGSLPQGVDATASGLSLLSKRGPPRGPRGPRKDKLDQGISGIPPFAMPPSPMGPLPGLPSMISPFWPMIPGRLPNGLPAPLGLGHRFASPLAGLPGLPGFKKEEITQSIPAGPTDINPYKCNFCSFVGTSREVLTSHVMKVHATDNQDLFSIFGIPSESLLNEKRLNPMSSVTSPLKSPRMSLYPPNLSPSQGIKREHPDSVPKNSHDKEGHRNSSILSPYSFMNGKYSSHEGGKDESIDILKQMTLKFGSGPVETPKKPKLSTQLGDAPLDLTKPRFSPPITPGQQSPLHQDSKLEDGNQSSGENSVYSNEMTSPTPRKRSRKGKAFKLDTLCRKLQEQQRNAMESDEDSVEMEEYPAELLPVDNEYSYEGEKELEEEENSKEGNADMKGETAGDTGEVDIEGTKNGQIKGGQEMGEDDFRQLHSSLEMLNETRTDNVGMIKTTDERYNIASGIGNKPVELDIVKQESSEYKNIKTDNGGPFEPAINGGQSRRKNIPAAVQRGVDIAWKMFNDPKLVSDFIKTEVEDDVKSTIIDEHKMSKHDDEISHTQKKDEYECPHCKISFGDCIMYTMHMGYHGYKDPYQCNMCGNSCKDRVEFNLHIARVAHS